jgi:hypothetical protein
MIPVCNRAGVTNAGGTVKFVLMGVSRIGGKLKHHRPRSAGCQACPMAQSAWHGRISKTGQGMPPILE